MPVDFSRETMESMLSEHHMLRTPLLDPGSGLSQLTAEERAVLAARSQLFLRAAAAAAAVSGPYGPLCGIYNAAAAAGGQHLWNQWASMQSPAGLYQQLAAAGGGGPTAMAAAAAAAAAAHQQQQQHHHHQQQQQQHQQHQQQHQQQQQQHLQQQQQPLPPPANHTDQVYNLPEVFFMIVSLTRISCCVLCLDVYYIFYESCFDAVIPRTVFGSLDGGVGCSSPVRLMS